MFLTEKAHALKDEYASFMKRFTGHKEEWGTFFDVKHWPEIKNPKKYAGLRVVIGSVTDGYNPQEEQFGNTRKLLEQLIGSGADILICTKSDFVFHRQSRNIAFVFDSWAPPIVLVYSNYMVVARNVFFLFLKYRKLL